MTPEERYINETVAQFVDGLITREELGNKLKIFMLDDKPGSYVRNLKQLIDELEDKVLALRAEIRELKK